MDGKEPESTQILRKSMMSQVHTHYSPVDIYGPTDVATEPGGCVERAMILA